LVLPVNPGFGEGTTTGKRRSVPASGPAALIEFRVLAVGLGSVRRVAPRQILVLDGHLCLVLERLKG
jgi:hypothetical protein